MEIKNLVWVGLFQFGLAGLLHAQQQPQQSPNAGVGTASYFPGNNTPFVLSSFILSQNPLAGVEFNKCGQEEKNKKLQEMLKNSVPKFDPKKKFLQNVATIMQDKHSKLTNPFGTEACTLQELKTPELRACPIEADVEKYFATDLSSVESAKKSAECVKNRSQEAEKMTNCFKTEYDRMNQAFKLIRDEFTQQSENMNNYVAAVKAAIEKKNLEVQAMDGKLQSLRNLGNQLLDFRGKLNQAVTKEGGGGLPSLQIQLNQFRDKEAGYEVYKAKYTMNQARDCFFGAGAQKSGLRSQCVKAGVGGGIASPWECIKQLNLRALALSSSGGSIKFKDSDRKRAENAEKMFESNVERILSHLGTTHRNFDSFKGRFKEDFAQLGPYGQAVLNELQSCYKDAEVATARDEIEPNNTELGQEFRAKRDLSISIQSQMASLLQGEGGGINELTRNAVKEMFGGEMNQFFNASGCENKITTNQKTSYYTHANLATQYDCIEKLAAQLNSVYENGTTGNSCLEKNTQGNCTRYAALSLPLQIPGYTGAPIRCQNIRDCTFQLERASKTSSSVLQQLEGNATFSDPRCPQGCPGLKKFYQDSNNQLRAAFVQVKRDFGNQLMIAQMQFEQLKKYFTDAGLAFPEDKDKKLVELDDLCPKSDDQLCKIPPNMDEVVRGLSGAPMVNNFDEMIEKVQEQRKEATKVVQELDGVQKDIKQFMEHCKHDKKKIALESIVGQRTKYLNACNSNPDIKTRKPANVGVKIEKLQEDLEKLCSKGKTELCLRIGQELDSTEAECERVIAEHELKATASFENSCKNEFPGGGADYRRCIDEKKEAASISK